MSLFVMAQSGNLTSEKDINPGLTASFFIGCFPQSASPLRLFHTSFLYLPCLSTTSAATLQLGTTTIRSPTSIVWYIAVLVTLSSLVLHTQPRRVSSVAWKAWMNCLGIWMLSRSYTNRTWSGHVVYRRRVRWRFGGLWIATVGIWFWNALSIRVYG